MSNVLLVGWKEFEQKANKMSTVLTQQIEGNVADAAAEWEELAKSSAPKDQGFLVQNITNARINSLNYEVVSPAAYSAYMEWGTKTQVSVPAEYTEYASLFQGQGISGNAKEMIYAWCQRVGIPKERWFWVFRSIMQKGVKPHPFFFIQKPIVEEHLINNINNILTTEH